MQKRVTFKSGDEPDRVSIKEKKRQVTSQRLKEKMELESLDLGYHSEMRIEFLSHDDFEPGKTPLSNMFSCEITSAKYEDLRSPPFTGTLYDPKMGSIPGVGDPQDFCTADNCGAHRDKCPGHFGMIRMPKGQYIFNPLLMSETIRLLSCICIDPNHTPANRLYNNHTSLRDKGILDLPPKARIPKISSITTGVCQSCHKGATDKKVKFEMTNSASQGIIKYKIGTSTTSHRLDANKIHQYFISFTPEEMELLGLTSNDPTNPYFNVQQYTLVAIVVPPISLRMPKVINGKKSHDDITVRLAEITTKVISWKNSVANDELNEELIRLGIGKSDTEKTILAEIDDLEKEIQAKKDYNRKMKRQVEENDIREKKLKSLKGKLSFMQDRRSELANLGKKGSNGGTNDLAKAVYVAVKTHFNEVGGIYQSKKGLIRSQILGKRSGHTSRAVIGPAIHCALDEVEIPERIAKKTGVPETVNDGNILQLQEMMEQGHIIEYKNIRMNTFIHVTDQRISEGHCKLKIGDQVIRRLMNGDVVIIGRQPSIHKGNFMAFRARITDRVSTNGIPFAVTVPFAGDFDGDTIHSAYPQTIEARREAIEKLYVLRNMIGGRTGAPIISVEYGALKIWHVMTRDGAPEIPKELFQDAWYDSLVHIHKSLDTDYQFEGLLDDRDEDMLKYKPSTFHDIYDHMRRCDFHGVPRYSGRSLFSTLLPNDFTYPPGGKPIGDDPLLILDGILVSGQLAKRHLGANVKGTIVHYLHKDYGWKTTSEFVQRAYRVADRLHDLYSFTFSYNDAFVGLDEEFQDYYENIHEKMEERVSALGPVPDDPYSRAAYEQTVTNIVNMIDNDETKKMIEKKLGEKTVEEGGASALFLGKAAGTKGGITEMLRTIGPAGQFKVRGERPEKVMNRGQRCLPTFRVGDKSLEAQGYSKRGMAVGGLSVENAFIGFQAVRDNQGDTALKTPISGDIARQLAMTLQNYKIENGMVVFRGGFISSLIAGEDGFNSEKLISVDQNRLFFFNPDSLADKINSSNGWKRSREGKWMHKEIINGEECYVEY